MSTEQFIDKLKSYAPEFDFYTTSTPLVIDVHREDVGFGLDLRKVSLSEATARDYAAKMHTAWKKLEALEGVS